MHPTQKAIEMPRSVIRAPFKLTRFAECACAEFPTRLARVSAASTAMIDASRKYKIWCKEMWQSNFNGNLLLIFGPLIPVDSIYLGKNLVKTESKEHSDKWVLIV